MRIHTIGDSHCKEGFENVVSHHLGPVLCYSFGQHPLERCKIQSFGIQENDVIIFCFGEIDCRCHIQKHVTLEKPYQKIITEIVELYMEGIKKCIHCLQKTVKVSVFNVVPPVRRSEALENKEFPFLGSDQERLDYVKYFNSKVKEHCIKEGFIFFDIYDFYADQEGFLRKDVKDESVHVKDSVFFKKFIEENF